MRNCLQQFVGSLFFFVLMSHNVQGQCSYAVNTAIEDLQTIDVQFHVENLVNSDLSGNQGICGVQLHFSHSYVGDITIVLTSPAGQSVQLVGEITDAIFPTLLTSWNVVFVPCAFPVSPDPGFSAQWDNNQSWDSFTTYTGSYYPANGCLEDFNMGSANGFWQLSITDHDAPQTGTLIGVTLIFCDNTGLICNVCGADGGTFNQTEFELCEGEGIIIGPQFADSIPDPQFFGYSYLYSDNQINSTVTNQFVPEMLPPGEYVLCGLSYSLSDSAGLFNHLDTLTFSEILESFENGQIDHCADLSDTCVTIRIEPMIDTTFLDQQICYGSTVMIGDQEFGGTGVYTVNINTGGSCDSVVVLDLEVIFLEAHVVQQDTITCVDGVTVLDGSSSIGGPGVSFFWTTANGSITSAPDQPSVSINGAGTYVLTINEQGCTDELQFDAIGDNSFPYLFFEGGTLTCNEPTFEFNIVAYPTEVEYAWNGPMGFTSIEPEPVVSVPGIYTLVITSTDGCSIGNSAEIGIDTVVNPAIQVVYVDCGNQRATLRAAPGATGTQYVWEHPVGMNTFNQETYATVSGQYCVTVTAVNGCTGVACIDYIADYAFPDLEIAASSDTVHCNGQVQLSATSSTPSLTYQWFGPSGLIAADSTVFVNVAGQYTLYGFGQNTCTTVRTITVHPGDDLFDFVTFTDTLNCNNDTVLIGVVSPELIDSYKWVGPGLIDTASAFVQVTQPGNYFVTFESQSGCIQNAVIPVLGDYSQVFFNLVLDTITCANPVAALSFETSQDYAAIDWLLPDGTHSGDSILQTVLAGLHDLTITGLNGCRRTLAYRMVFDTVSPTLFIESDILGCTDSVLLHTIRVDSIQSYQWSGPSGFSSSDANPFVSESGNYLLHAIGFNGCESNFVHFVEEDMTLPTLSLTSEELDCIDSTAILELMSPDSAVTYAWYLNNQLVADSSILEITEPGTYLGVVTGYNDCVSMDSVTILPPAVPSLSAETDTITCIQSAILVASSDEPNAVFEWEEEDGTVSMGPQLNTSSAGTVVLTMNGPNGCTRDTTLIIGIDTIAPVAIPATNEEVLCNVPSIHLDASGSIGTSLSFLWTTPNGVIDSGVTSATPLITGPGVYVVHVADLVNGCTDQDSIVVVLSESNLGTVFYTAISECEGNSNGSITIDSVPGGVEPFIYLLNGEEGGTIFSNLSSGQYQLMVVDSFGCTTDTTVEITNSASTLLVTLGPDLEILLGDSVLLEALTVDPSQILSVHWDQQVSCDSCLANTISPKHTAVYSIHVEDVSGCIASDEVTIIVDERPKYFIPSVFSPNGDEINDFLQVYAHPGIERILRFTIYDRWGNAVYHRTDFDPADLSVGWDGTFDGKKLDPAVFVYLLEVKLITGRIETNHGNVTLVK